MNWRRCGIPKRIDRNKSDVLVREMAEAEGVDEEMKENEQMEWVRRMEMICGRVEEVVREEIIG